VLRRRRPIGGQARDNRTMMKRTSLAFAASWAISLALGFSAAPASAQNKLPPAVLQALKDANVSPDAMAVMAIPLGHRAAPFKHRASVPMQPASTLKLVTSVVALDRLGPNFRSYTEMLSAAPVTDGVLQGDLVLRGGADPELGVPQFWALLLELRQRGITRIQGDLIVDRTLFRPARMDIGVPPFDDEMEFQYNVIPDALELAGNLLPLEIRSGTGGTGTAGAGSGITATTVPLLEGIEITSRMAQTPTPCKDWDKDWKPAVVTSAEGRTRIELQGGFPADCTRRTELQLIDRLELADRLFRALWQGLGGQWAGRAREAAAPDAARLLVRRNSRPWGEVLRPMVKTSDNPVTRLLFLQLGVPFMAAEPQATTAELAARVVRNWFDEHHIDTTGLVLDNGSGLSRSERITPQQLASLLAVSWAGPNASDLMMSIPVAGVDGSIRPLKDSPAANWARLKPGTLRNVAALAGYIRDPQGRPWAVAMMINDDNSAKARPALLAFVDSFARFGPLGPVRPLGTAPPRSLAPKHRKD
jgi:D-alanyl-D-alanine carboxypeptidase/D-alanyl-D-alanine-endopeptidase (penicillin-binding protein 4)